MSILTKEVKVNKHPRNYKNYHGKFLEENNQYVVPVNQLSLTCTVPVEWVCDSCGKKGVTNYIVLQKRRKNRGETKDYCHLCANRLSVKIEKHNKSYKENYLARGGDTEETRKKKRDAHLGKKHSEETLKRITEGVRRSIPSRKKIVYRLPSSEWVYASPRKLKDFIQKYGDEKGFLEYRKNILEKTPRRIEYWLLKTNGDELEAKALLNSFQSRNINYWVSKYGEIEGEKKYLEWCTKKSINKCRRYSKLSKDFFDLIVIYLGLDKSKCFYGPEEVFVSLFKEERQQVDQNLFFLDFMYQKCIIEFNGVYWHRNSQEHDRLKKEILEKRGYKVLYIEELEVISNLLGTLEKIGRFIDENSID